MTTLNNKTSAGTPEQIYEFRIKGHLDKYWTDWFGPDFSAREENGNTLLTGPVMDQSALHGLIKKVRDLGAQLLSVICINPEKEGTQND